MGVWGGQLQQIKQILGVSNCKSLQDLPNNSVSICTCDFFEILSLVKISALISKYGVYSDQNSVERLSARCGGGIWSGWMVGGAGGRGVCAQTTPRIPMRSLGALK